MASIAIIDLNAKGPLADPDKIHNFPYDIFLAGPPDRRVSEPYKRMFKEAFPELLFYDWETYTGADYQDGNHRAIRDSFLFVGFVPDFPLPTLGEEVGYFYCFHEHRIKYGRRGLQLNCQPNRFPGRPQADEPEFVPEFSPPINPIILIWPDRLEPKFSQKTFLQMADIVPTTAAAIDLVRSNLSWLRQWKYDFYPHIRTDLDYNALLAQINRNMERRKKDPFFELPYPKKPVELDNPLTGTGS
ncbi:MAG: hypothetical protein WC517_00690 [Patescibacteria group bacterium]